MGVPTEQGIFVSYFDGIVTAVIPSTASTRGLGLTGANTGQQPGDASRSVDGVLSKSFNDYFKSTFQSDLQTVFSRGAAGEFDDKNLSLAEQLASNKLKQLQSIKAPAPRAGSSGGADGGVIAAGASDGSVTGASVSGGSVTGASVTGASVAGGGSVDMSTTTAQAERDLFTIRIAQSNARLVNIASKLNAEYPAAASIESASAGTYDPLTYQPKTKVEVVAFAQRMVIDATEGAARLEIVKNELDLARLTAKSNPSATATAKVTELTASFQRQKAYVATLAAVVDRESNSGLTDTGTSVLAGQTVRSATDLSAQELVTELRKQGASEAEIKQVVGIQEDSVDEAVTPGGSSKLRQLADTMLSSLMLKYDNMRQEARASQRRKEDDEKYVEKKAEQKQDARTSANSQSAQRGDEARAAQRQLDDQAAVLRENEQQQAINAYLQQRSA
jgi:hypothetical protein